MTRAIAMLATAAIFLLISPNLQEDVAEAGTLAFAYLNAHSPISYIVLAIIALAAMALVARSAEPCRPRAKQRLPGDVNP